jgi:hypothetical protein
MALTKKTDKLLTKTHRLPQRDATWECTVRKSHSWVEERNGRARRPWFVLAVDLSQQLIATANVLAGKPTAEAVLTSLLDGMNQMGGAQWLGTGIPLPEPSRPARILIDNAALADELRPHLARLEIEIAHAQAVPACDAIFDELSQDMNPNAPPPITRTDGLDEAMALEFFAAADMFYRAAPWEELFNEDIIEIRFGDEPAWYCSIMGGGGQEFGLSLYPAVEDVNEVLTGKHPAKLKQTSAWLGATFDEEHVAAFADLDFIEQHGIQIATEMAYPLVFSTILPTTIRPATLAQVQMIAAAFRTLPQFVIAHMMAADDEPQPAQATFTLPDAYGGKAITLAFPVAGVQVVEDDDYDDDGDEDDFDDEPDNDAAMDVMDAIEDEMAQMAEAVEPGAGKLMMAINSVHPPVRFALPAAFLKQIKPKPAGVKADEWYEPMGALYAGADSGLLVALAVERSNVPLVCPISQLRVEEDHPLTAVIKQYQASRAGDMG